jgi:hypothetical protein
VRQCDCQVWLVVGWLHKLVQSIGVGHVVHVWCWMLEFVECGCYIAWHGEFDGPFCMSLVCGFCFFCDLLMPPQEASLSLRIMFQMLKGLLKGLGLLFFRHVVKSLIVVCGMRPLPSSKEQMSNYCWVL